MIDKKLNFFFFSVKFLTG